MQDLVIYLMVGFAAQLIDGALGMAYGVSSTTFLLSTGVAPAAASASVHTAEIFTTAASGISHFRLGNISRPLFNRLVIPGVIGGIIGAYVLTSISSSAIKPFVAAYLLLMGLRILWKSWQINGRTGEEESALTDPGTISTGNLLPLAFAGGLSDAIGGGGWGPIVTTTLVANNHTPRTVIGSVNAAEFFVTIAQVVVFMTLIFEEFRQFGAIILGLIVGGVIAAPLAALVCKRISPKTLMRIVGGVIVILQCRTLLMLL